MYELKPCPTCHSPYLDALWFKCPKGLEAGANVYCRYCKTEGPAGKDKADAENLWNELPRSKYARDEWRNSHAGD